MTSLWRKIIDLTYAFSAMFTGAGFNTTLKDLFGDKSIEDMWLPYFCGMFESIAISFQEQYGLR